MLLLLLLLLIIAHGAVMFDVYILPTILGARVYFAPLLDTTMWAYQYLHADSAVVSVVSSCEHQLHSIQD